MRRKSNRLTDAADRIRVVVDRAEKAGAMELVIEAMAELATTSRQAGEFDEVDHLLGELERVALDPAAAASVALPAATASPHTRSGSSASGATRTPLRAPSVFVSLPTCTNRLLARRAGAPHRIGRDATPGAAPA